MERRAYSASRRREWRSYSLRTQPPSGEDEGKSEAGREDVVRQLFDGRTGRYRGLMRVVPPADWFATLCACAALAPEVVAMTPEQPEQGEENERVTALCRLLEHELRVENIPVEAVRQWLALLPAPEAATTTAPTPADTKTELVREEQEEHDDDEALSMEGGSDLDLDVDIEVEEDEDGDGVAVGHVAGGCFASLLLPEDAPGGRWSILCRVVSLLGSAELGRLSASCQLFRARMSAGGMSSTAALPLPEWVAWHRVCDTLARKGGAALGGHRRQIEAMRLLEEARPRGVSWAGLLHRGVGKWVRHVQRQVGQRQEGVRAQPSVGSWSSGSSDAAAALSAAFTPASMPAAGAERRRAVGPGGGGAPPSRRPRRSRGAGSFSRVPIGA